MDEARKRVVAPGVDGLLEGVEDEVGPQRRGDAPAHNAPGKHIHDERGTRSRARWRFT